MDELLSVATQVGQFILENGVTALSVIGGFSGVYSFYASGSWVKVETYYAIHNGNSLLRLKNSDVDNFPFAYVNSDSHPVLVVRARNLGRSPISVEGVEIVNTLGNALPYVGEPHVGNYLPQALQPGSSKYWQIDLEGVLAVSEGDGQTHKPLSIRAQISLANNTKKKTQWINHKTLVGHREHWCAFALKLTAFLKTNVD